MKVLESDAPSEAVVNSLHEEIAAVRLSTFIIDNDYRLIMRFFNLVGEAN